MIDLTGERYGKLLVVEYVGQCNDGHAKWRCICDCGKERITPQNRLRGKRGNVWACNECMKKEAARKSRKHGDFGTRLYSIYYGILDRVNNKNSCNYKRYGGRGIKICDEWALSYLAFKEWSLLHGYKDRLSIDRIDVNGNYCPENCRWATAKAQGNNRRDNHFLTIFGETRTMQEWGEKVGLSATAIRNRMSKGLNPEEAVSIPYRCATKKYIADMQALEGGGG